MEAIREFGWVVNGKIEIKMPPSMEKRRVEVLILPLEEEWADDLSHLEEAIEEGIRSGITPKTHEEIFKELTQKYA